MLQLPEEIGLPRPDLVPLMVAVAGRHPKLNLLNLEAVATAHLLQATVWLSPEGASGSSLPSWIQRAWTGRWSRQPEQGRRARDLPQESLFE